VVRKFALVLPKCARVVITPPVDQTGRMLNMQHLVIEDVFNKPLRNVARIQRLADGDTVVNMVVMTKDALGASSRPRNRRLRNRSIEITTIQLRKHPIEIINLALGTRDHLSSAST